MIYTATGDIFQWNTDGSNSVVHDFGDGQSAGVSASGRARIRYNNATHRIEFSENGGAYAAPGGITSVVGVPTEAVVTPLVPGNWSSPAVTGNVAGTVTSSADLYVLQRLTTSGTSDLSLKEWSVHPGATPWRFELLCSMSGDYGSAGIAGPYMRWSGGDKLIIGGLYNGQIVTGAWNNAGNSFSAFLGGSFTGTRWNGLAVGDDGTNYQTWVTDNWGVTWNRYYSAARSFLGGAADRVGLCTTAANAPSGISVYSARFTVP